jgi:hypothetical protein
VNCKCRRHKKRDEDVWFEISAFLPTTDGTADFRNAAGMFFCLWPIFEELM